MHPEILTANWDAYQLIDSGHQRKLERFGDTIVIRSEPKAWWDPDLPAKEWDNADAVCDDNRGWILRTPHLKRVWLMPHSLMTLQARITDGSKHLGIFPEQSPHWEWISQTLRTRSAKPAQPRVLNLFGYTGAASLAAAASGAHVTHVDASKPSIAWARDNQVHSQLENSPIRWLLEDALKYVQREIRRGSLYEGILLDPPSFGRGPRGEVWKVEQQIVEILTLCRRLLSPNARFLVLTLYNLEASSLMLRNLVASLMPPGSITFGELALNHAHSEKKLPLSLWCRWHA